MDAHSKEILILEQNLLENKDHVLVVYSCIAVIKGQLELKV